jgi:glucose-1-phosphatase
MAGMLPGVEMTAGEPAIDPARVGAVVFDLGGVILEVNFERVFGAWARDAGVSVDSIRHRFRLDADYERHERGEYDATRYFAALRHSLGLGLSDARFLAGWNCMVGGEIGGVAPLLERFAGVRPMYVFSNTNAAHHAHWGAGHAALMRRFRRLFLSFEMGMRKPEARAFEFIAREIGVPLENILFFDDTAENVEAARDLGIQAILVRGLGDLEAVLNKF